MSFTAKNFEELTGKEVYEILRARSQVFMLEQDIRCLDMDRVDYQSRHFFLQEEGGVIAYLRAFYEDEEQTVVRIGRVLTVRRGEGLGKSLMRQAIADIARTMPCKGVELDSQSHAIGFYEKLGFRVVSDEFLEEGVPHVVMRLERLPNAENGGVL